MSAGCKADARWVVAFDGIWACASLLHVSEKELETVLVKFHRALKRDGVLYASWKYGEAECSDGERFYCDMTEEKMRIEEIARVLTQQDKMERRKNFGINSGEGEKTTVSVLRDIGAVNL